jgi:hypothetical protein
MGPIHPAAHLHADAQLRPPACEVCAAKLDQHIEAVPFRSVVGALAFHHPAAVGLGQQAVLFPHCQGSERVLLGARRAELQCGRERARHVAAIAGTLARLLSNSFHCVYSFHCVCAVPCP